MKMLKCLAPAAALAILAGCANYRWKSSVPEEFRTVSVPVFENRTHSAELGSAVSRQIRREFQREGTFSIKRTGSAALELQGTVVSAKREAVTYDRGHGMRAREYRYIVTAEASLVDKRAGRVLFDGRKYTAETTFLVQGDVLTGQRNAAQRIANELARQIADDVLSHNYGAPAGGTEGARPSGGD